MKRVYSLYNLSFESKKKIMREIAKKKHQDLATEESSHINSSNVNL